MRERIVFLTEFVIALAVVVGVAFAWQLGVVKAIWQADESYMTSAIAALFVVTVADILRKSWESRETVATDDMIILKGPRDARLGHWAERSLPMLGLLGTVIGVSLQAQAKASGLESLSALQTGLYASACGMGASFIISYMTHVLESGE